MYSVTNHTTKTFSVPKEPTMASTYQELQDFMEENKLTYKHFLGAYQFFNPGLYSEVTELIIFKKGKKEYNWEVPFLMSSKELVSELGKEQLKLKMKKVFND